MYKPGDTHGKSWLWTDQSSRSDEVSNTKVEFCGGEKMWGVAEWSMQVVNGLMFKAMPDNKQS